MNYFIRICLVESVNIFFPYFNFKSLILIKNQIYLQVFVIESGMDLSFTYLYKIYKCKKYFIFFLLELL